jgi:eukaryotic-like serine/threonine-protein kinase
VKAARTPSTELLAGRYALGEPLGHGGMGEVREALDVRLEREVAVKLLRPELASDADVRRRFEREARAAARISHPHVVAVFDTGEHDGVPFIVMERLSGATLANEIAKGPMDPARAGAIALEVVAALEAAHRLGVIHRDIKPGNILIGTDGAKVADFGIATIAEGADLTTTGLLVGTTAYLPPERLAGEPASESTDLYGVGVVLFEALAGRPPFRADTPLGLVAAITTGDAPSLAALCPEAPPELVAVAERAMAAEPGERFESAPALAGALRGALGDARSRPDAAPTVPHAIAHAGSGPPLADTQVAAVASAVPPPAVPARPRRGLRFPVALVALAVAALLVVIVVAAALVGGDDGSGGSPPAPSTVTVDRSGPATAGSVPPPLDHALDRLDRAVSR